VAHVGRFWDFFPLFWVRLLGTLFVFSSLEFFVCQLTGLDFTGVDRRVPELDLVGKKWIRFVEFLPFFGETEDSGWNLAELHFVDRV
jgi:hypothetical protein